MNNIGTLKSSDLVSIFSFRSEQEYLEKFRKSIINESLYIEDGNHKCELGEMIPSVNDKVSPAYLAIIEMILNKVSEDNKVRVAQCVPYQILLSLLAKIESDVISRIHTSRERIENILEEQPLIELEGEISNLRFSYVYERGSDTVQRIVVEIERLGNQGYDMGELREKLALEIPKLMEGMSENFYLIDLAKIRGMVAKNTKRLESLDVLREKLSAKQEDLGSYAQLGCCLEAFEKFESSIKELEEKIRQEISAGFENSRVRPRCQGF